MNRIYASIAMLGIATTLSGMLVACSTTQTFPSQQQVSAKDLNNQGVDKLEREDYKGAIEDFNRAIQLNPQSAKAFFNRGFAHANLENYQNAINDYTQAVQLNPQDSDAYYNRGLAHSYLENQQAAVQDFQKAAQLYQQQGQQDGYQDAMKHIRELQK